MNTPLFWKTILAVDVLAAIVIALDAVLNKNWLKLGLLPLLFFAMYQVNKNLQLFRTAETKAANTSDKGKKKS